MWMHPENLKTHLLTMTTQLLWNVRISVYRVLCVSSEKKRDRKVRNGRKNTGTDWWGDNERSGGQFWCPKHRRFKHLPRKSELGPSYPDIALLSRESLAKNDIKTAFEKYLGWYWGGFAPIYTWTSTVNMRKLGERRRREPKFFSPPTF